jgi:hypothetical protein
MCMLENSKKRSELIYIYTCIYVYICIYHHQGRKLLVVLPEEAEDFKRNPDVDHKKTDTDIKKIDNSTLNTVRSHPSQKGKKGPNHQVHV